MKRFNKVWPLLVILFFIYSCRSKHSKPLVGRVGDKNITLAEFSDIYRFNPNLAQIKNSKSAKKLLLNALIVEKLLAAMAERSGMMNRPMLKAYKNEFKREALIEKFWQNSIFSQIRITKKELRIAYRASKEKRVVRFLSFADSAQAWQVFHQLKKGTNFGILKDAGIDTITFESRLPAIRSQVFKMRLNQISPPVLEGGHYFILKLVDTVENIFRSKADLDQHRHKLEKILRLRKSYKVYRAYLHRHFKEAPYSINKTLFKRLVQLLDGQIFRKNKIYKDFFRADLEKNSALGAIWQKPIVHFKNGKQWTVKELLRRIEIAPYPIDFKKRGRFRMSMIAAVKHILDDELIAGEAQRLGLDKTDYVQAQQQMWMDYILSEMEKTCIWQGETNPEKRQKLLLKEMAPEIKKAKVYINYALLDTLSLSRTDMFVYKTNFPERYIAPALKPVLLPDSLLKK